MQYTHNKHAYIYIYSKYVHSCKEIAVIGL